MFAVDEGIKAALPSFSASRLVSLRQQDQTFTDADVTQSPGDAPRCDSQATAIVYSTWMPTVATVAIASSAPTGVGPEKLLNDLLDCLMRIDRFDWTCRRHSGGCSGGHGAVACLPAASGDARRPGAACLHAGPKILLVTGRSKVHGMPQGSSMIIGATA